MFDSKHGTFSSRFHIVTCKWTFICIFDQYLTLVYWWLYVNRLMLDLFFIYKIWFITYISNRWILQLNIFCLSEKEIWFTTATDLKYNSSELKIIREGTIQCVKYYIVPCTKCDLHDTIWSLIIITLSKLHF